MITNTDNNVKINWLTNRKAAFRFMTSMFNKRDFFKDKQKKKRVLLLVLDDKIIVFNIDCNH